MFGVKTVVRIKICGLKRHEDIDIVNEALPDYVGFVFAESRRRVAYGAALEMKKRLDRRIMAAGVFVNAKLTEIERVAAAGIIDLVQLHGDEDAGYVAETKRKTGLPVIKAVRVRSREQIMAAQALPCDYLLLDAFDKSAYGGTGRTFDYGLIPKLEKPFFLAGGLNAENIGRALAAGPYGVDVGGGAETDGVKDAAKIREIIMMVREERV